MPQDDQRTLAVFDFDHTLIKGDSFFPFLAFVAGWPLTLVALFDTLLLCSVRFWKNRQDPALKDPRTFIKAELLKRLIAGREVASLTPALSKLSAWQQWNEPIKRALLDHYHEGHHIVIASGGLSLYLRELLKDMPLHALIATDIGIDDGILTGVMTSGNCVRDLKAERVAAYIAEHGPFATSWGYGNFPHDVEMLQLLKHRIIV